MDEARLDRAFPMGSPTRLMVRNFSSRCPVSRRRSQAAIRQYAAAVQVPFLILAAGPRRTHTDPCGVRAGLAGDLVSSIPPGRAAPFNAMEARKC
jgi:hypothetical protein